MRKDLSKGIRLLITGLFVAVIIYPFLHELGHIATALVLGLRVRQLCLFPLPQVLCEVDAGNSAAIQLIGMGGILLPLFLSITVHPKRFLLWYAVFVLRLICALSVLLSFFSVGLFFAGASLQNEDLSTILAADPDAVVPIICLLYICLSALLFAIISDRPIQQIYRFFS